MTGVSRGLQDPVSWAPQDVPKREITPAEVREALRRRADGQGWQTIANVHGVNVLDLRRACGDPTLPAEFQCKVKASSPRRTLRAGRGERDLASLLEAVEQGCRYVADVFRETNLGHAELAAALREAKSLGLVEGGGKAGNLRLTEAGGEWLEARRG